MRETTIKIPPELFALAESSHFEGTAPLDVVPMGPDDYVFDAPVIWQVDVTNTGSAILVAGSAAGSASCNCARCLEPAHHDFEADIEGYFLIEGVDSSDGEEDEFADDEFDVLPASHEVDLLELIVAALMVDAPDMPLCRDDCKGLCPQCGANLNDGTCACAEKLDPMNPFAALAGLKFD